ncbi:MAG TPA: FAD-dependent oxidoreductase [Planctomycetota bacterium]|nr:FAD-dependent oxidoreductase [Planctomycetota bacterium]
MSPHDCVIVGAGIHGLCTAFWLRQRGVHDLLLLERHGPGHDRGSSHGQTRITRSSYHEPFLVRLAERAHREAWPALEREFGRSLRVRTPGVFFGPASGPFGDYLRATLGSCRDAEQVTPATARQRFPLLRFPAEDAVLVDQTAAMLLAADTIAGLRAWLAEKGVELRWHTPVLRLEPQADYVDVVIAKATVKARTVVLAAGPWLPALAPPGHEPLTVQRQEVGYFDVAADEAACRAGTFPVWARIGETPENFHYGLPSHANSGLKAAVHRTTGPGCDPDAIPPAIDDGALMALARERFAVEVRGLRAAERCLYTMTGDQGLRVGRHARIPQLVVIAACSGHAFKFGPIIGQMAADLVAKPA